MYPEKPNFIFFNIYRNFVGTTKDFDKLERIEKIEQIHRAKNRLTALEKDITSELERLHNRFLEEEEEEKDDLED